MVKYKPEASKLHICDWEPKFKDFEWVIIHL